MIFGHSSCRAIVLTRNVVLEFLGLDAPDSPTSNLDSAKLARM